VEDGKDALGFVTWANYSGTGFSMNKWVETDNLYKESVVAKGTISDYVAYVGGIKYVYMMSKN